MTTESGFGRVAVLMGGRTAERDISLQSGNAVLTALQAAGVDAVGIDVGSDVAAQLTVGNYDRAFIALHGRGGEDGQIQGVLSAMNMPFTGSGILGAALSMNKQISKQMWQAQGLLTPAFEQVDAATDAAALVARLGLPLVIKPVSEGSSIGMSKVNDVDALAAAITTALKYEAEVIAEKWVTGTEYTITILGEDVLPVIKLTTPREFYDYEAKYQSDSTEYLCPCGLSDAEEAVCQVLAIKAFRGLRMTGWGRIDVMRAEDGQFYLIEANSVPGMTDHSLVPMAAKAAGLDFKTLVMVLLVQTLAGEDNG